MSDILADLRFTWRSLRRRPAFAFTAILTLALGIGVNTGVFTLVNAILLKPLPVFEPDRLVELYSNQDQRTGGVTSYADLKDLQRANTSFTGMSGHSLLFANLNWKGRSELLVGEFTTSNYMDVLGIRPQLGRFFTPQEETVEGAALSAVIGHQFWQTRYAGDPSVLGQTLQLNGKRYEIVGVMPESFRGTFPGLSPDVWIPIMMAESLDPFGQNNVVPSPGRTRLERRGARWLWVTARLREGVTPAQAQSQMQSIMSQLATDYPQSNKDFRIALKPSNDVRLNPDLDGYLTAASAFLLIAVGIVLLVACTNVAGMFLARSSARRREIAVRVALGTSRWRLIRQLLIESVSISMAGGVAGLVLAIAGTRLLVSYEPPIPVSLHLNLDPDWRVFLFTVGVSFVTGIFFGLVPALQSTRRNVISDLKGGDDQGRGSRMLFRNGLVVSQLALSLVLLVGAGLLVRSMQSAGQIDLGFRPEQYALVQFNLGMYGYSDSRGETFFQDIQQRFRGVPGVEAVTMADRTPMSININMNSLFPTATPAPDAKPVTVDNTSVDPGYFEVMRVPIVEGRGIGSEDSPNTPRVAVVSQAMAKQLWPGESAVGKRVRAISGRVIEIVGVSRDYKVRTVGEAPRPMIHYARRQSPQLYSGMLVRTSGPAQAILPQLRQQIAAVDPELVPFQMTTLLEETSRSLFFVRAGALILAALGTFTVFLAGVGLYGLIAYSVSRRTREIGTRIALGATRTGIVVQVIMEGSKLLLIGAVIGLAGAAVVSRLMQSLLYGISSFDWLSFLAGTIVLALIAVAANAIPAFGASRIDPIRALKID